jgi:hypothetical protein
MARNAPGYRGDVENPNATHLKEGLAGNVAAGKVNIFDPAAAPLGTDDEAAGNPASPEQLQKAALHEAAPQDDREHAISAQVRPGWRPYHIYLVGTLAVLVIVIAIYWGTR